MRKTSRAAVIDRGKLVVRARKARRGSGAGGIVGVARHHRLAEINLADADFVYVSDVVQVQTMRPVVLKRHHCFVAQSPVYREAPELRLRHLDILCGIARADWW